MEQKAPLTSTDRPLYINKFPSEVITVSGSLGMTMAPGKKGVAMVINENWARDLGQDLDTLKNVYKTDILVSLMEDFEFDILGISDFKEKCVEKSIKNIRFHIVDGSIPEEKDLENFIKLAEELKLEIENGKNVVIHCRGGLGRTGTLASCILVLFGFSPKDAIEEVRKCRKGTVENEIQEKFVENFPELLKKRNNK